VPIARKAAEQANPGAREDADDTGWLAQENCRDTAKHGTFPDRHTQALAIEKDNDEQHGQAAEHSDSGAPEYIARELRSTVVAVV
jgi:hypothetical protein